MIKEYGHVHDNEILSYYVDIYNKKLQIFTKYYDTEQTTITFFGLMAHRFENVTYCNIIFDIIQISIDDFINNEKELLEYSIKYAFPICVKDCEELRNYLNKNEQNIFEINSSLGLSGFVIAKEIHINRVVL
jgi:hypothetical protein